MIVVVSGSTIVGAKDTEGELLKQTAADVLMHELLGHAIPRMTTSDTGNAIKNENKAREQIKGAKLRRMELGHHE